MFFGSLDYSALIDTIHHVTCTQEAWIKANEIVNDDNIKDLHLLSWKIRDFAFDVWIDCIFNEGKPFSAVSVNVPSNKQTTLHTFSLAIIISRHIKPPEFISEGLFLHCLSSLKVWNNHKDNYLFIAIKCSNAFWQTDSFILWNCPTSVDISSSYLMTPLLCLEVWVCFPYKTTWCFWHTRGF